MPRPATVRAVDDPTSEPEPAGRIITVDYDGHTYRFDADQVTIQVLEDFDDRKFIRAIRGLLGADQWAQYKARHPRGADLDPFIAALFDAASGAGNSSASSVS